MSVAARHQLAVEKLKNARQMLFRANFWLVRFERLKADYDLAGLASWPALRYRTP